MQNSLIKYAKQFYLLMAVINKKIYHIITTKNILKIEENIHVIMKAKVTNSKILHGSHSLYVVLTWVT
jgi:hypothetical protein